MGREVIDSNVLTIASAPAAGWVHPRIPLEELRLIDKVFEWVKTFRDDPARHMVLDLGGTIESEYKSAQNMPDYMMYGRRVIAHKFQTCAVHIVELEYWHNGAERVARLPTEIEALIHDLGDRKMIAAAYEAGAALVNACDSDWTDTNESTALAMLGIELIQILTDDERTHCRGTAER